MAFELIIVLGFLWPSSSLPCQPHHAFNVKGLWEEVNQVDLFDAVSKLQKLLKITRQGSGIAGEINDLGHPQGGQHLCRLVSKSRTRRVDYYQFRLQIMGLVQELLSSGLQR